MAYRCLERCRKMADEDIKVSVAIQGQKIQSLSELCVKMDIVIEKIMAQHDRRLDQIYEDIDMRRRETDDDIKEIHSRIDTVLERVQGTEKALMNEIKSLRAEIHSHNVRERETISKLLEWRWMVAGGIFVVVWLLSHAKFDTILQLFK